MGDWITIDPFTTDEIVRAKKLQAMWSNLYSLFEGEYEVQQLPGPNDAQFVSASTTFVNIDAEYFNVIFESFGGDLMVIANMEIFSSSVSGQVHIDIVLDGESKGNSDGLYMYLGDGDGSGSEGDVTTFVHVLENVDAGSHELTLQFKVSAASARVGKGASTRLRIRELN